MRKLSSYLERWTDSDSFREQVAPYVKDHVREWPRGSFSIPRRWKQWVMHGHKVLPLLCFRSLSLARMRVRLAPEFYCTLWTLSCLQHLEHLDLSETKFTHSSLGYLMGGADRLKQLRALDLSRNPHIFSDRTGLDPFDQPRFRHLKMLSLKKCEITATQIEAMARHGIFERLEMLKLSHNAFGDEGVRALTTSQRPGRLTSLDLVGVGMTQRGARALSNAHFLAQLVWFSCSIEASPLTGKQALGQLVSQDTSPSPSRRTGTCSTHCQDP